MRTNYEGYNESTLKGGPVLKEKWAQLVALFSVLLCFLWVIGLGLVIDGHFRETNLGFPVSAPPVSDEKVGMDVLALGDSLTRGTGDGEGKGYVGFLIDHLKESTTHEIHLSNLGIKGQTSVELMTQVKQEEVQRQITQADTILITIGGNDLLLGGQTLMDLNLEHVQKIEAEYLKNINSILTDIRALNTEASIYLIGLYNPFAPLADGTLTSKVVMEWNAKTADLTLNYPKTVFVPTFDLFQLEVENYLYSDKFHPNTEGYRLIAERLGSLIRW